MIVNPGIRRFLGSAIQRLFNSAAFALPLTHSLIPTRGDITPSFTRATTETGQKYDEAGYLDFTALAGEVVFKGARRVRNLLTATESVAAWTVHAGASITDLGGGEFEIDVSGAALNAGVYIVTSGAPTIGRVWVGSIYIKAPSVTGDGAIKFYNPAQPEPIGGTSVTLTSDYQRASTGAVTAATGTGAGFWFKKETGKATLIRVKYPQLEDVTGQTTQTASEYVSVGVESAPAYHGSMVDGVKCYDTDRSGNPISTSGSYPIVGYVPWEARTNLCLQSNAFTTTWLTFGSPTITQNVVGPDGATSAWTLTDATGADFSRIYQSITLTAATHTLSLFVKKAASVVTNCPLMLIAQGANIAAVTMDNYNGVATIWTSYGGPATVTSSARCSSYNDDYWRFELTFLATAASWTCVLYPCATSSATQASGVEAAAPQGSAVFYGAQVELGSTATPYQPTTTLAAARNADVLTYPSVGVISASEGTVYAELSTAYTVASGYKDAISSAAGTGAQILGIGNAAASTTRFTTDGSTLTTKSGLSDMSTGTRKVAVTWGGSTYSITGDGATPTSAAFDGSMTVTASFGVGCNAAGTGQWNGNVRNVRIWNRKLSASELQAITA